MALRFTFSSDTNLGGIATPVLGKDTANKNYVDASAAAGVKTYIGTPNPNTTDPMGSKAGDLYVQSDANPPTKIADIWYKTTNATNPWIVVEDVNTNRLDMLVDVMVTEGAAINNFVLTWDNTATKWVARDPAVITTNTLVNAVTPVTNPSGNILTSTVNGVVASAPAVNLVAMTNPINTITTTVNGVAGTTSAVNTVANAVTVNNLVTTVNGVAATATPVVNTVALAQGTVFGQLKATVNGVDSNSFTLPVIGAVTFSGLGSPNTTNPLGSKVGDLYEQVDVSPNPTKILAQWYKSTAVDTSWIPLTDTSTIVIQDEGTAVATTGTLNFTGAGVTASGNATAVTVNVPGLTVQGQKPDVVTFDDGFAYTYTAMDKTLVVDVALAAQDSGAAVTGGYFTINAGTNLTATVANSILTLDNPGLTAQKSGAVITGGSYNTINLGTNLTGTVASNIFTINATGGGGGVTTSAVVWGANSSGSTVKNAYSSPGVINSQPVTITFSPTSDLGPVTAATVTIGGATVTGTYTTTDTFPLPFSFTIPTTAMTDAIQLAGGAVVVTATYNTVATIFMPGTLTVAQAVPATQPTLNVAATNPPSESVFFPPGTGTITATAMPAAGTTLSGVMYTATPATGSPTTNATGVFPMVPLGSTMVAISAGTVSGSAGGPVNQPITTPAQTRTITQPTFTPAYWTTTANMTQPTLDTSSANPNQTASDPTGQTITISNGNLFTNYVWLMTTAPISRVYFVTTFGNVLAVPDRTYTTMVPVTGGSPIAYNIFGFTDVTVNDTTQFVIAA